MKKVALIASFALLVHAGWMDTVGDLAKQYGGATGQKSANSGSITSAEETTAVKDALRVGIDAAIKMLGKKDGFYKNPLVRIPVPDNVKPVASTLRKVGMGSYVDKFELSMNRAAEEAIPETSQILYDTIKGLSVQDAKRLIFSNRDDAITEYFKQKTAHRLLAKITPIIKKHMENEQVTHYYQVMMHYYNKSVGALGDNALLNTALGAFGKSAPKKVTEKDLTSYVANRALDGLFAMIEKREKEIRHNPTFRTTRTLREVFATLQ